MFLNIFLDEASIEHTGHTYQMYRREAVSRWLCQTTDDTIQQEVNQHTPQVSKRVVIIMPSFIYDLYTSTQETFLRFSGNSKKVSGKYFYFLQIL